MLEAAVSTWDTWPKLPWCKPGLPQMVKLSASWTEGHLILVTWIMRWGNPSPALKVPFVFSHDSLPSPITYIFQCSKSYKLYVNTTYKDAASFLVQGKAGVVKAQEAAASTSRGQGPGGGRVGTRAQPLQLLVGSGAPPRCHSLRLNSLAKLMQGKGSVPAIFGAMCSSPANPVAHQSSGFPGPLAGAEALRVGGGGQGQVESRYAFV